MSKTSFGTFFELGGRGAMEALTRTGLDYVIIDTEHGCLSEETTAVFTVHPTIRSRSSSPLRSSH